MTVTIEQMLGTLLDALNNELVTDGSRADMCSCTIYPGDAVPMDYGLESCGGMAWVRLVAAGPTTAFPSASVTVDNCTYSLAYTVEMGIMRPAPIAEQFGSEVELPDDTAHFNASNRLTQDLTLMHRAIKDAKKDIPLLVLGSWTPQGPQGGTVGGTWTLTVGDDGDD